MINTPTVASYGDYADEDAAAEGFDQSFCPPQLRSTTLAHNIITSAAAGNRVYQHPNCLKVVIEPTNTRAAKVASIQRQLLADSMHTNHLLTATLAVHSMSTESLSDNKEPFGLRQHGCNNPRLIN